MPDARKLTAMHEHYARGLELGRLAESTGQLEFERTKEIILRHLPPPPAELAVIERTGRLPPLRAGSFCGYTHRPGQLRAEVAASGFQVLDLVSVEGPAYLLDDLAERLADDEARRVVLETARALERVPELLGIGPHLLAIARR